MFDRVITESLMRDMSRPGAFERSACHFMAEAVLDSDALRQTIHRVIVISKSIDYPGVHLLPELASFVGKLISRLADGGRAAIAWESDGDWLVLVAVARFETGMSFNRSILKRQSLRTSIC